MYTDARYHQVTYFNNFALDPHRIQAFSHPPVHTGGGQPPPPQAYGLLPPAVQEYPAYPPAWMAQFAPPPAAYVGRPHWDAYAAPVWIPPPQARRDEAVPSRRLSDRISGFAHNNVELSPSEVIAAAPASAGLPAKPVAAALDATATPMSMSLGSNVRRGSRSGGGPPPPPPPDVKEDPRAAAGRKVSYHDMDLVAEGDVELTY